MSIETKIVGKGILAKTITTVSIDPENISEEDLEYLRKCREMNSKRRTFPKYLDDREQFCKGILKSKKYNEAITEPAEIILNCIASVRCSYEAKDVDKVGNMSASIEASFQEILNRLEKTEGTNKRKNIVTAEEKETWSQEEIKILEKHPDWNKSDRARGIKKILDSDRPYRTIKDNI